MKSAAAPAVAEVLNITEDSAPLEESKIQDDHIFAMAESVPALQKINNPIEFRENFAETAFFYPALVTDEAGDVTFSFTMPESVGMAVADVPAGQTVDFVNVETGEVVLKELPKSETEQRLDSMEAALAALVGGEGNG